VGDIALLLMALCIVTVSIASSRRRRQVLLMQALIRFRSQRKPQPRRKLPPPEPPRGDWQSLVGREIEAVIVTGHGGAEVRTQAFLVLDGNEHFEIYAFGWLKGSSKIYPGGLFELLSRHGLGPNLRVYGEVEAPEPRAGES